MINKQFDELIKKGKDMDKMDFIRLVFLSGHDTGKRQCIDEIKKIREKEEKKLEKEQKECVKNSYDPTSDTWNKKHFNRCDGDVTAGKLDIIDEILKKLKK